MTTIDSRAARIEDVDTNYVQSETWLQGSALNYNFHFSNDRIYGEEYKGIAMSMGNETSLLAYREQYVKIIDVDSTEEAIDEKAEKMAWLAASEASFSFWDNDEDAVYDDY